MNQGEEVAGHREGKGSHKICMVYDGPGGTMGTSGPERGNYFNTKVRM
jgi:hypothetical protein